MSFYRDRSYRWARWAGGALLGVFILLAVPLRPVSAQDVFIRPDPRHPGHASIHLASLDMDLQVTSGVASVTLTQVFRNPNPWQAEGTYLFPLPEGATVTGFRLTMDGEPVSGEVLDRRRAREIYLDIVRRIRDPALLEWMGNRAFQARIFPFPAGGERTLELSYSVVLPQEGDYRVFQYLSGRGAQVAGPVPMRRDRFVPDVMPLFPEGDRRAPRTRFVVQGTVRADQPVRSVYSPTHALDLRRESDNIVAFSAEGDLRVAGGFQLYYASAAGQDIGIDLLTHRPRGEDGYFLLTVNPGLRTNRTRLPKDLVFVLDTSGSMGEDRKLEQAVAALRFGLGTLGPEDRFTLVTYSSTVRSWREQLVTAGRDEVADARDFAASLSANGGTNIAEALLVSGRSLDGASEGAGREGNRPRYVVFLTDGLPTVGERDPDRLLDIARDAYGEDARVFVWGVGYDVNAFLLDALAGRHQGRSAYVVPGADLEGPIAAFFEAVSDPILSDPVLTVEGGEVYDLFPRELPDLFAGASITVMGRWKGEGQATFVLGGRMGERVRSLIPKEVELPARQAEASFLAPMWAQRKVGFLLEQIRLNGESQELKEEIIRLGERYGIVTPYTAYLVVEDRLRALEEAGIADMESGAVMARAALQATVRPDASVYAGAAGSRQQTGQEAVQLSMAEKSLQGMLQIRQSDLLSVQRLGEKTFRLAEENQAWRDVELTTDQRLEEVTVGSEQFLELLDAHPELARWVAQGPVVEVQLGRQGYRIVLPESQL